jgi:hypothetical protein
MTRTIAILGIIACAVISAAGGSLFYFGMLPVKAKVAAAKPPHQEHCIGKVVYLQFDNAVVTKVRPDGKLWTCGGV